MGLLMCEFVRWAKPLVLSDVRFKRSSGSDAFGDIPPVPIYDCNLGSLPNLASGVNYACIHEILR